MQETSVQSLAQKDLLKRKMAAHPSILAWESHGQRNLVGHSPWYPRESDLSEQLSMHESDIQQNLEDIQKSRGKI